MTRWSRNQPVSLGARYRSRGVARMVWEVAAILDARVGPLHFVLVNVENPSVRKTLSEFTLEQSGLFDRVRRDHAHDEGTG